MRKKLIFVITKSNWGGAQRYVFDMAVSQKNNYDVVVVFGGEGELAERLLKEKIKTISVPHLGRDISILNDFQAGLLLYHLFKIEKPDIVHLNSSKVGGFGGLAARSAGIRKIVFTLHGLALNENREILFKCVLWIFYWLTIFFSHTTIAVSYALKNQSYRIFPLLQSKVKVVQNGIGLINFHPKEEALRILGVTGKFVIGTIGELHHIKGHEYLIQGFKKFIETNQNSILIIIGEGEERSKLESLIKDLKLEGHVSLPGHVPNAGTYLKAFDIFVLSSLSEALAYVVLEAGAAGIPVIATNVGGVPEVIIDNETGFLISPLSPEEISEALQTLANNLELRLKLGDSLKQKIETEFSLEKMIKETQKLY